ncbi:hypothetical protein [Gordonia araii]|uniref:hypothetical protein n=1 Tax=Gordonia araii TaxID=263909 RepID=UPI0002EB660F|nr:hypothetical protein [Gordonia araii]NNG96525.1 hypothetical protein [Gordonia araii NBRC 100433]
MSDVSVPRVVDGEVVAQRTAERSVWSGPLGLPGRVAGGAVRAVSRVPVVGRAVDASVGLAVTAAQDALTVTRDTAAAIAREAVSILTTETDLTGLIESIDLDRLLGGIDLDRVLRRIDVNALVEGVSTWTQWCGGWI